ncbi:MAG: winged helix DNA-binding domain-containing protein [Nocardioidaceae bacterium]|nr:winged helix DNA-binding domain-containing protein [Nocardioidaceae bacterium]
MAISREQVLGHRFHVQQLDRVAGHNLTDVAVLDLGVQDTGSDGALWAMANRGVSPKQLSDVSDRLALAWTLRGAPHFYRRAEVAAVAAACAPFSEADAGKRIFDAAKPLKAASISPLEALDVVAAQLRDLVVRPMVKGDVSSELTARLSAPYVRTCRPCKTVHCYEMPFRLAALRAGLELVPESSPPVLRPIPGWTGAEENVPDHLDVVRACLHFLGPSTPKLVAAYFDAPVNEVKARWPDDAVEVHLAGETRWLLPDDLASCGSAAVEPSAVRLLGPYDLFLQARDRELLGTDPGRRKAMWVALGRPGAVVTGGEIVGTWRPRASGSRLKLLVDTWSPVPEQAVTEQAEQLAAHRGITFAGYTAG